MEDQELKSILIEELGSMPFKDKRIIKESRTIPKDMIERLILKNKKRFKFTKTMIYVLGIVGVLSLFACFWFKEDNFSFIFLTAMVLVQLVQLSLRPEFIDNSKKDLIFKLFDRIQTEKTVD